jgi:hypothetical protein
MDTQGADAPRGTVIIGQDGLDALIGALAGAGYKVIGPTVSEGAIAYDEIDRAAQLPIRLDRRAGARLLPPAAARGRRYFRVRGGAPFRCARSNRCAPSPWHGNCLRAKCEADQHFGYELVKRFPPAGPHAAGAHPPATARRL